MVPALWGRGSLIERASHRRRGFLSAAREDWMSRVATGPRRPGGRWVAVLLAAVSLTPALAGCDSNGEASGKVAQAKVTVKEKALTDAKSDFADKSAAACD